MSLSSEIYLGFDFGYKRIGLAVGQKLTFSARPLKTLVANEGVPNWREVQKVIEQWCPCGLVVGRPTRIQGGKLYTTKAAERFAQSLEKRFLLPVFLADERLSTVEARSELFAEGGYRKIKKSDVDSVAACVILEHWFNQ